MADRDYSGLLARLAEQYARRSPRSAGLQERAGRVLVDGGSHALRLVRPFPPRITAAHGAWITDEDGHRLLDFWQGHMANILGHNPPEVTEPLARAFAEGWGLQTGLTDRLEIEVAELLCARTGAERVRFTTSGTLATMYATMLARAFTGRQTVLKVGGGWHGAQPFGLKGVGYAEDGGFQGLDSAGLSSQAAEEVQVTRFNDPQRLEEDFARLGDRLACFIVEPFLGSGGGLPADPEYLAAARRLCDRHGALLIFDEVIAGFRFRAGDAGALYGIRPDLWTFGKIIGGGMPLTAVAGRAAVLAMAGRDAAAPVRFQGGTYSAHPATMLAARSALTCLIEREAEIYPRLSQAGEALRHAIEAVFREVGIYAVCTGYGNGALPPSSIVEIHFPRREGARVTSPEEALDPRLADVVLADRVLRLALLVRDVHSVHGLGALSTAHGPAESEFFLNALREVAHEVAA